MGIKDEKKSEGESWVILKSLHPIYFLESHWSSVSTYYSSIGKIYAKKEDDDDDDDCLMGSLNVLNYFSNSELKWYILHRLKIGQN